MISPKKISETIFLRGAAKRKMPILKKSDKQLSYDYKFKNYWKDERKLVLEFAALKIHRGRSFSSLKEIDVYLSEDIQGELKREIKERHQGSLTA